MAEITRVALFGKLGRCGYGALENATIFCKMRGNPHVDVLHWLVQILALPDADVQRILRAFSVDAAVLLKDLTLALEKLPTGGTAIFDFSPRVEEAMQQGWLFASLMFGDAQVRTGHLLVALLKTPRLRDAMLAWSREWNKIDLQALCERFSTLLQGSPENEGASGSATGPGAGGEPAGVVAGGALAPAIFGKQQALQRFAVDLTEKARRGEVDPVVGRDQEIRQVVDILLRRRQNNPILTGEAGVGKTAVVEGLALKIVDGDVPPSLQHVSLRALDLGLLQAGASMKGEFEQRLRQVVDEVQASPQPIILFVDEAHTLIGAGGQAGTADAANLLKPALARGTLRTIAATTWAEYKRYIEKDPALTRRFQVVQVHEPSEAMAVQMMRRVAVVLEQHHGVEILDEAVEACVKFSHRYIPARQLPDKAVSLLDTACARVAVSQHALAPQVQECLRTIEGLQLELAARQREAVFAATPGEQEVALTAAIEEQRERLSELQERLQQERQMVQEVIHSRRLLQTARREAAARPAAAPAVGAELEPRQEGAPQGATLEPGVGDGAMESDVQQQRQQLEALGQRLGALQGQEPLVYPAVDTQVVAAVVSDWTGIPVGRMVKNEIEAILRLQETLGQRVLGQEYALATLAMQLQSARAQLGEPHKPQGVFLLAGPSGVGKTETALALAEALFGGEQHVITINMSEFQEPHTVSTLKGAPPGYVGYGEGGVLTEAVRRKPYSVVLLDEIEKAHRDVHEIFYQVFDKGGLDDGEGRRVDFSNTVILLTSNVGSELMVQLCADPQLKPAPEALAEALRQPLLKVFPAAFLGRVVVVPYLPLSDASLCSIVQLKLNRIVQQMWQHHRVDFSYDEAALSLVLRRCTAMESGGRMVDAVLTQGVLPRLSGEILRRMACGQSLSQARLSAAAGEFVCSFTAA